MLVGVPQRNGSVAEQPGLSQPVGRSAPPCRMTRLSGLVEIASMNRVSALCFIVVSRRCSQIARLCQSPRQMAFMLRDFMNAKSASTPCSLGLPAPCREGVIVDAEVAMTRGRHAPAGR